MNSFRENHKEFIKTNRTILKLHQRFRRKKYNVLNKEDNKIVLSVNDDKRMHSIDSMEA